MLRVRDVAELLGASETTVYMLAARKRIDHFRVGVGRGALRFRKEDVEKYIASCRVEAEKPEAKGRVDPISGYQCKFLDPSKIGG